MPGRARRDAIEGLRAEADGSVALRVSVRAAPEDGKANAAIAKLLAATWDVPKTRLRLTAGATDRRKMFSSGRRPGGAGRPAPRLFMADAMDGTAMNAKIIDGKAFAEGLRGRLATEVAVLKAQHGFLPGLAVVLVGEDPASQVYVRNKAKQTSEVGMASFEHKLAKETGQAELLARPWRPGRPPGRRRRVP